jgi:hypothetical protein
MKQTLVSRILAAFVIVFLGVVALQTPALYAAPQENRQPEVQPLGAHLASLNWAGYTATEGSYTSVSGSWVVPEVKNASVGRADAAWVGIGGVESHDLIQAGTQAVVTRRGVQYQAWYEMLPDVSIPVPLAVRPGDCDTQQHDQ